MNDADGPVDDSELHARIDGRLPPQRMAVVEAYLTAHPEERERWREHGELRDSLRAALAGAETEAVPARLCVRRLTAELRRRRRSRLLRVAAGLALFAVGGLAGWSAHDILAELATSGGAERIVVADAAAAYRTFSPETRHPVEVGAGQQAHLEQWLSKRLGRRLVLPDLSTAGFRLIGGRLLPAGNGVAGQLMYEDAKALRLTCYYSTTDAGADTGFEYRENRGVGVVYWADDGFGYAVAGAADRDLLLRVSKIAYRQISGDAAPTKPAPASGKPG